MRAKVLPPPLQTSLHSCQVFQCLVVVSHQPKNNGSVLGFLQTECFMISGETFSLTKDRNICCTWNGLAIKDFSPKEGAGVVATRRFSKGDIVCDYHGKVITAAKDTFGRRINHSSKMPNLKPLHCVMKMNKDVVLFAALQDINVDTQQKFDYGVKRKSFRGDPGPGMAG
ncbi:hypothetical protein QQF64_033857 [Cirrhinus molitorella]|uniref:SET domain-containing protein n=1 Tax=Cirrhinus molitorella TaxID=172907 RepID=A0ABR3MV29_9TELE